MKLDGRIIEGKKPLDCFDAENKDLIKSFLNKQGYFSNNLKNFCFLNKCPKRFLSNVFKEIDTCFKAYIEGCEGGYWKFFLPAEWVKNKELKYRPFTLNEFLVTFPMLTDITMREKGDNDCIITCTVTAYRTRIMSTDICLGVEWISLKELFDKCEYKNTLGDWMPFGEEIEE